MMDYFITLTKASDKKPIEINWMNIMAYYEDEGYGHHVRIQQLNDYYIVMESIAEVTRKIQDASRYKMFSACG